MNADIQRLRVSSASPSKAEAWSHHARHVFFPLCNMDDRRWRSRIDGLASAREEPDAVR
jgi:hypothetical protein